MMNPMYSHPSILVLFEQPLFMCLLSVFAVCCQIFGTRIWIVAIVTMPDQLSWQTLPISVYIIWSLFGAFVFNRRYLLCMCLSLWGAPGHELRNRPALLFSAYFEMVGFKLCTKFIFIIWDVRQQRTQEIK